MATKTAEFKLYSGSIEQLRGGEVLATYPCTCGRCSYWSPNRVFGRREARIADPRTSAVEHIVHARPESLGLAP
jgi:hypothetical protein